MELEDIVNEEMLTTEDVNECWSIRIKEEQSRQSELV